MVYLRQTSCARSGQRRSAAKQIIARFRRKDLRAGKRKPGHEIWGGSPHPSIWPVPEATAIISTATAPTKHLLTRDWPRRRFFGVFTRIRSKNLFSLRDRLGTWTGLGLDRRDTGRAGGWPTSPRLPLAGENWRGARNQGRRPRHQSWRPTTTWRRAGLAASRICTSSFPAPLGSPFVVGIPCRDRSRGFTRTVAN